MEEVDEDEVPRLQTYIDKDGKSYKRGLEGWDCVCLWGYD